MTSTEEAAGPAPRAPAEFDRAVAVRAAGTMPRWAGDGADGASTSFAAELDGGWSIGVSLNGGYLLGVLGSAARAALPDKPHPVTLSACFVGPAAPGPAEVSTRVVRDGRGTATLAMEMTQHESPVVTALATTGDLAGLPDDVRTTATPPRIASLEECSGQDALPEEMRQVAPLQQRFDMRFDPATSAWVGGEPSGRAEIRAWFSFRDGREPDPLALLLAVDALPPVLGELGTMGWAPTVELTVHVRAVPAPGWLRVRHATRNLAGGFFEEDCEVWDSADRLVAQSRQLAKTPRETG